MVDIGKLDKRITFQRYGNVEDDMGQDRSEWQDYKTVWATVKPYKSSEVNFMDKLRSEVTHRFYARFRTDITAEMRIKYRGKVYEIAGTPIDMDEAHELLEIQAVEVVERREY